MKLLKESVPSSKNRDSNSTIKSILGRIKVIIYLVQNKNSLNISRYLPTKLIQLQHALAKNA